MRLAIKKGVSFGLTSGIITTLGLLVGLYSGTSSQAAVLGGILTIAIADAMSDAMGMHMSEETEHSDHTKVWLTTIATFITKFLFALTFAIPVLLFDLDKAVIVSIVWGMLALVVINYKIAVSKGEKPAHLILEHLAIACAVIILTYLAGLGIANIF